MEMAVMHGTARVHVKGYAEKRDSALSAEFGAPIVDHESEWRRLVRDTGELLGGAIHHEASADGPAGRGPVPAP